MWDLQGTDTEGRRVAGWLGGLDPSITCLNDVPDSLMPRWFAALTIQMDEGTSDERWMGFMARYRAVLGGMDSLPLDVSDHVRDCTLISALEIAMAHDRSDVVQPTINLLHRRLAGEDVTAEMGQAEKAALAVKADPNNAEDNSPMRYWFAAEAESARAALCAARANVAQAAKAAANSESWGKFIAGFGKLRPAYSSVPEAAWDHITNTCLSSLEMQLGLSR